MRPTIAITMGDPAGIGPEIAVKALNYEHIFHRCIPVVIGDMAAISDALTFTGSPLKINRIADVDETSGSPGVIDLIDLGLLEKGSWEYKKVSPVCGKAAYAYIEKAINLALDKKVHAVVTGPINKESLNKAGYHYSGHTEIFAKLTGTSKYAMLLSTEKLKVIHVTTHVSLRKACDLITRERVLDVIHLADSAMKTLGYARPKIAVAGLNPHSSEGGLFGNEEAQSIIPAVSEAKSEGIDVEGPVPPDTVFVKALAGQYDIVVAMYHDQGHIPIKLLGFNLDSGTGTFTSLNGVNCTVGLPIIRTSVDHGTAFEIAGEGKANETSLIDAIDMAVRMVKTK
ncbi:MAG: 4-hydroxythreonine-4-phosphate dehydrogenase PdxA [Bacillota bacterium]